MAIQEVIKYEGDNDILIYKHPAEDFNTLSQLIVHESQEAVFFSDGQALDSFKAGRYTLETKNIPLISKLRNLVTGGVSPFHTEVYFINLATMMDIPWGTPSQVTVKDPNYGYSYSAGASGSFGLKIIDGRKLLINLVGTEQEMSTANIQKYFKDLIVTRVKNCIAVELSRYSYNEFNQHLNDISENVAGLIRDDIAEYGIQILNFFLSAVNINEDDLIELKNLDNSMAQKRFEAMCNRDAAVIEAQGLAKSREIQGYNWQQEQQFNVSKAFAENEGFAGNPANMMAQIPLAPVLTCAGVGFSGSGEYNMCIGARPGRAVVVEDKEGILKGVVNDETIESFARYVRENVSTESNMRGSAEYRSHLAEELTKRALRAVNN